MRSNYSLGNGRRRELEISMTPMIDVIFLLLVFFISTSSFQIAEKLLPSGVSEIKPAAGVDDSQPPPDITTESLEQVIVKISNASGAALVTLNGQPLSQFDELQSRLIAVAEVNPATPVIIDPGSEIKAKHVVTAYDWARAAGLTSVYLATRGQQ
jgi:biopolymer transport protein ExbD